MVQRVGNPRLQESQTLHGDGEVVVVARKIFTRFRIAVSFSLRSLHAQGLTNKLLTVRPVAHAVEKSFRERNPFFELVDMLAHGQEALVGFAHPRERIQEAIRDTVDDSRGAFGCGRMCDMLVHDNMLREIKTS